MLNFTDPSDEFPGKPSDAGLAKVPATLREVMVPVFMRVTVPAEDDLQAECLAVDVVRSMGVWSDPARRTTAAVASVIAPLASKSQPS